MIGETWNYEENSGSVKIYPVLKSKRKMLGPNRARDYNHQILYDFSKPNTIV